MEQKSKSSLQPSIIHPERVDLTYLKDLFSSEVGWHLASVMAWIIEDGRHIKKPARFIEQLCDKLIEAGAPVWRFGLDVRTIHPRFAAWQLTWSREARRVDERMVGHCLGDTVAYDGSPTQRARKWSHGSLSTG